MNGYKLQWGFVGCFMVLMVLLFEGGAQAEQLINWMANYPGAVESARVSSRPVLLYLLSHRARACYDIKQQTFSDPAIQTLFARFVCVKINVFLEPSIPRRFHVFKVPTILLLDAKSGKELGRAVGFKAPGQLKPYLMSALNPTGGIYSPAKDLQSGKTGGNLVAFRWRAPDAKAVYLAGDFND